MLLVVLPPAAMTGESESEHVACSSLRTNGEQYEALDKSLVVRTYHFK